MKNDQKSVDPHLDFSLLLFVLAPVTTPEVVLWHYCLCVRVATVKRRVVFVIIHSFYFSLKKNLPEYCSIDC